VSRSTFGRSPKRKSSRRRWKTTFSDYACNKDPPQCAHDTIESAIDEAADDDPVILWWDDGGYLRDIVEHASTQLRCEFRAAEQTPLELRADAPRDRTVWYVPQPSSDDVDWFKDVEHTGGVVEQHIGKLAARCFENDRLQAATIRTAYEDAAEQSSASPHSHARGDADAREKVAQTLYEELDGEGGLPSLQGLQTKIVLNGHDDPVQFVLEHGTRNLPDGEGLLKIRDLLVDDGVTAVEGESDARTIVERTRRWAVAEWWFVDEGLDKALLPQEYQPEPSTGFGVSRPELRSMLSKTERKGELANVYLDPDQRFWHDVLRSYDPWELVDCPVDASRLNTASGTSGRSRSMQASTRCARRRRHSDTTASTSTYGDVPWTVWEQAVDVATLAAELETWGERGDTSDVVDLYGTTSRTVPGRSTMRSSTSSSPASQRPGSPEHPATRASCDCDARRPSLFALRSQNRGISSTSPTSATSSSTRSTPAHRSSAKARTPVLCRGAGTSPKRAERRAVHRRCTALRPRTRTRRLDPSRASAARSR